MADFSPKEWCVKPQISHRHMNTRRFSASNWKSFREDERSTRTISSTVSSPGYTGRDKIDPSTYSFTAAIKGLQRRGVWSCEYVSIQPERERLTLHSKWSDAEKYISNPLSGQVPVECLSAKALGVRSFSTLTNRIAISAPLHFQTHNHHIKIQEKKRSVVVTRDVGTQSADVSVSAPHTPSIQECSPKHSQGESVDSYLSTPKQIPQEKVGETERKKKEIRNTEQGRERKKKTMMMMCSQEGGRRRRGCLLFKGLWQRRNKCNCKPKKNTNTPSSSSPTFLYHINACYDV
ncbi:hypothetical protein AAHA92_01230 [Salvia divinorum]|uniref:Uncharacterized protein n=1 Tax=Salvia divinorum TaxID=28513 RepID=A0ABD1IMU0_SALDI